MHFINFSLQVTTQDSIFSTAAYQIAQIDPKDTIMHPYITICFLFLLTAVGIFPSWLVYRDSVAMEAKMACSGRGMIEALKTKELKTLKAVHQKKIDIASLVGKGSDARHR